MVAASLIKRYTAQADVFPSAAAALPFVFDSMPVEVGGNACTLLRLLLATGDPAVMEAVRALEAPLTNYMNRAPKNLCGVASEIKAHVGLEKGDSNRTLVSQGTLSIGAEHSQPSVCSFI